VITYESNWRKARDILLEAGRDSCKYILNRIQVQLDKMTREYLIDSQHVEPVVFTRIEASGVKLTLRYPVEVRRRRTGEDALSRRLLEAFEKSGDVEFAYSTYRITGGSPVRGSRKKKIR